MNPTIENFLAQKRIAVAGVSRNSDGAFANAIYRKLRDRGHEVVPINPNAESVEGDRCYADLKSIPQPVDGVFIATTPQAAEQIVRDCAAAGVSRVWMHRSFGAGSVSEAAVKFCNENKITVIAGGCPMMFCEPVDFGHKCMRWILKWSGGFGRRLWLRKHVGNSRRHRVGRAASPATIASAVILRMSLKFPSMVWAKFAFTKFSALLTAARSFIPTLSTRKSRRGRVRLECGVQRRNHSRQGPCRTEQL